MFAGFVCARYMHDLCMRVMTHRKTKKKRATNLHDTIVQMIPWNCQHVSWCLRPLRRGGGSSLLILESCEEAGERWSCWARFSRAKLGKRGLTPVSPPWSYVYTFSSKHMWRGKLKEGDRMKQRGGFSRSQSKKKKKSVQAHGGRPLAPAPLPCDGACAWECALARIVRFSAAFFVSRLLSAHWCLRVSLRASSCACVRPRAETNTPRLWSQCRAVFIRVCVKFAISPAGKG